MNIQTKLPFFFMTDSVSQTFMTEPRWKMASRERNHNSNDRGGPHSTMDTVLASRPAAPSSILSIPPKNYWCCRG